MAEAVVEFLRDKISPELIVFIVSMTPILELRGGLIAAAILGIEWYIAFPLCVIGNMIPIPLELLFIRKILELLKKNKLFSKFATKLDERAKEKSKKVNENKFALWGLYIFVAVPLPGTGAWTGGLVADVLDIRMKKALPVITIGVISAGLIISFISYVIPSLF